MKANTIPVLMIMFVFIASAFDYVEHEDILHQEEINALQKKIVQKENTINELEYLREEHKEYNDLIHTITESIIQNDESYGLGGVREGSVLYSDEETLKAVSRAVENRSPDQWMYNVGQFFSQRSDFISELPDIWPVRREQFDRITSSFGLRRSPIDNRIHTHEGIDITTTPRKGEVVATAKGKVIGVWNNHPRFGKIVYLQHANNFVTRYAHLDSITIEYEQTVEKGQLIGYIGDSGISAGQHLHYEIRKHGSPIDPVKFMLIQ